MRASSVLLDHNAAGASQERYTHIFISSIDRIGSRQGDLGSNCEAILFYQRKRRSRSFDRVQPLEDRMQRFHHLGGIAAITLAARAERLDLDRRALGVGRSQLTALGGVRS